MGRGLIGAWMILAAYGRALYPSASAPQADAPGWTTWTTGVIDDDLKPDLPGGPVAVQAEENQAPADAPDWVKRGSGAFKGEEGRVFYGVGVAPGGIRSAALRLQLARDRAAAVISKTVDTFSAQLARRCRAATLPDEPFESEPPYEQKKISRPPERRLPGVRIAAHWVAKDGTEYVLAALDLARFIAEIERPSPCPKTKADLWAQAEQAFDELAVR